MRFSAYDHHLDHKISLMRGYFILLVILIKLRYSIILLVSYTRHHEKQIRTIDLQKLLLVVSS